MPYDPWAEWTRMLQAGRMVQDIARQSAEVVEARSDMLSDAVARPHRTDWLELSRMVTEKNAAFARTAAAIAADSAKWQRLWADQASDLMKFWVGGQTRALAVQDSFQRLSSHSTQSTIRALKPVHAATRANSRRLRTGR